MRALQAPANQGPNAGAAERFEQTAIPVTEPVQAAPIETTASRWLEVTAQVLSESPQPPLLSQPLPRGELKTASEAGMIELDLAQHPQSSTNELRVMG